MIALISLSKPHLPNSISTYLFSFSSYRNQFPIGLFRLSPSFSSLQNTKIKRLEEGKEGEDKVCEQCVLSLSLMVGEVGGPKDHLVPGIDC